MWDTIDGKTILTTSSNLAEVLPDTARVRISDAEAIVADYELWKRLARQHQSSKCGE